MTIEKTKHFGVARFLLMDPGMLTLILLIAAEYPTPLEQKTQPSYVPQSVALSGPKIITDYHVGDPIPAGYHSSKRLRVPLIATGFTIFSTAWFSSAVAAAIKVDSTGSYNCAYGHGDCPIERNPWALFLPIVGPLVELGNNHGALGGMFLVLDAVIQAGSLTMAILGLVIPKIVLVRNDVGGISLERNALKF